MWLGGERHFENRQALERDPYQTQHGHNVCTPTVGSTPNPYGWPTVGGSEVRHALGVAQCTVLSLSNVLDHTRKVDIRLPEKEDSNSHGARPVHQKHRWNRTSRLSIKNSLSPGPHSGLQRRFRPDSANGLERQGEGYMPLK